MSNEKAPNYRQPHVFDPIHNGADECECGLLVNANIHERDDAYEERMRPRIVNAPDRIWLQVGCDNEVGEIDWKELSHPDVSWCAEKIDNTDIEYARVSLDGAAPIVDEGLRKLLASYTEPCTGDCDHSQCPLLRELHELQIKATLERARLTVKPIVDREREGESNIGDLMGMRLRATTATAAPAEQSERLVAENPFEQIVERALLSAGISYATDHAGDSPAHLDFYLPAVDVHIEVKTMHSDRVAEQMSRVANVIVAQGRVAIEWLASRIFPATAAPVEDEPWSSIDNWPIPSVLEHLAGATEHLLHDHNCDEHGWETWKYAAEAARKHVVLSAKGWQYKHERDAELIRKDGMMCEAHPGLEFGHVADCGGPGTAWAIEGRSAIEPMAAPVAATGDEE